MTGRKVFATQPFIRLLFSQLAHVIQKDGEYIIDGFHLPEGLVDHKCAEPNFVLKADCFIVPLTVENEKREECIMILQGPLGAPTAQVMIPRRIVYKVGGGPETYPQTWQ